MDTNDRESRDAAGVGPYVRAREKLVPLSTLGSWKVSDGEPDIRDWEVRTVSNRQLGTVKDLLIDTDAGDVVMLDVDLPEGTQHTYVPIRVVHIDRERRVILMDSADLPASELPRQVSINRTDPADGSRVARYPKTDDEVIVDRPTIADNARSSDHPADDTIGELPPSDRRRAERRHIDRMSTDL